MQIGGLADHPHGLVGPAQLPAQHDHVGGHPRRVAEGVVVLRVERRAQGAQVARVDAPDVLVATRVLNGDGGQVGEQLGRLKLVLVEGPALAAVQSKHADDGPVDGERRQDRGLGIGFGARHHGDPWVAWHVVDQLGLVVTYHPTADALVQRAAPVLEVAFAGGAGVGAVELLGLGVDETDLEAIVVDHPLDEGRDAREHAVVVEGRQQGAAQLEQDLAQLDLRGELGSGVGEQLVLSRVLDGDRGLLGQGLHQLDLVGLEVTLALRLQDH